MDVIVKKKRILYLQGYKIDRKKMRNVFPKEEREPEEFYEAL
jgi:hypothetical protein